MTTQRTHRNTRKNTDTVELRRADSPTMTTQRTHRNTMKTTDTVEPCSADSPNYNNTKNTQEHKEEYRHGRALSKP